VASYATAPVRHARVLAVGSREPAITDGRYVVIQPSDSSVIRVDTETGRRVRASIPAVCVEPFIVDYRLGVALMACVDGAGVDHWLVPFDGSQAQLISTPQTLPDVALTRVGRYWFAGGGVCDDPHDVPQCSRPAYVNRSTGAVRTSPTSIALDIDSPGLAPYRLCRRVDRYERVWRSFVAYGFPLTRVEDCAVPKRRRRPIALRCRHGCDDILVDAGWVSWVNSQTASVYARSLRGRRMVTWRLPDPPGRAPGVHTATTHTRWALLASIVFRLSPTEIASRIYYVPLPRERGVVSGVIRYSGGPVPYGGGGWARPGLVRLVRDGRVVASRRVAEGRRFRFQVAAGEYTLGGRSGEVRCEDRRVAVLEARHVRADLICEVP